MTGGIVGTLGLNLFGLKGRSACGIFGGIVGTLELNFLGIGGRRV